VKIKNKYGVEQPVGEEFINDDDELEPIEYVISIDRVEVAINGNLFEATKVNDGTDGFGITLSTYEYAWDT